MARGCWVLWALVGLALSVGCREDLVLLDLGTESPSSLPSRIGPSSRIPVGGSDYFLAGANLPWKAFGDDFGTTVGAATSDSQMEVEPLLANANGAGVRVIRWFMFTNTPPDFTAGRFSEQVLVDLNAAIDVAERNNLYLMMVLFSNSAWPSSVWTSDEDAGNFASAIEDLVRDVNSRGRVLIWSIHSDIPSVFPGGDAARSRAVQFAQAARNGGASLVAWGSDQLSEVMPFCDLGGDLVTVVEQGVDPDCPRCTTYADLVDQGFRCPVVINTHYVDPGVTSATLQSWYYDQGYAGAFSWPLNTARTTDPREIDLATVMEFNAAVPDEGPP